MDPRQFWAFSECGRQVMEERLRGFAAGRGGPGGGSGRGGPFGRPPGGGFPPFGGPGFFGRGARARKGDVRAAILVLLAEGPANGYQLMQEIEKRSDGAWKPSPGSMYPALQQLEDEALVRVEASAGGRTFHLTEKGVKEAKAKAGEPAPWAAAEGGGRETAVEFHVLIRQLGMAALQVVQAGNPAQVAEARKVLAEAKRSLYRILAEDAPVDDE